MLLMLEKRFDEYSCRIRSSPDCFFHSFGSYAPARYGFCISQVERQFSNSILCNALKWREKNSLLSGNLDGKMARNYRNCFSLFMCLFAPLPLK